MLNLLYNFTWSIGLITFFQALNCIKHSKSINIYFVIAMFFGLLRLSLIVLQESLSVNHDFIDYSIIFIGIFNYVSIYLYFKNLNISFSKSDKSKFFHFIPTILLFFIPLIAYKLGVEVSLIKKMIFIYIIYMSFYLIKSFVFLKSEIWNTVNGISDLNKYQKIISRWTKFLFICLVVGLLKTLSHFELVNNHNNNSSEYSFLLEVINCFLWSIVFLKTLFTPGILYGYNYILKNVNDSNEIIKRKIWKSKLSSEINSLQEKDLRDKIDLNLKKYILSIESVSFEKTFQNPDFKIADLAHFLAIPKSHILFLYKHHCSLTFSEYKKLVRIERAISLINLGYLNNNTLDSLATKVGFSSYTPFYSSFKDFTGVSPNEFLVSNTISNED